MPGTNLTRDEAAARATLLDVTSYAVDLDLTSATNADQSTFASTTTLEFTCRQPGSSTFADLVAPSVREITLNGRSLDPATAYADSRIALDDLEATNTLVVVADCAYSNTGEGLHRFVDPVDDRVYLYSQFEVPDARRVFTTFEQPDLKSVFTFNVTAPADWVVVSNAATPEPTPVSDGVAVWNFPTTKKMSTYITAIVAGEYHGEFDTYEGKFGTIPLGHYCRQSLKEHMDTAELVKLTKQSFAFFEEQFDYPYPFGKYDQLYVPEYNAGAMENAGCVTLRDEYLPRSRQARSFFEFRASVITHEMAHMWFGDLVTMKWWDDLWLNESFAEWACYWCEANATEFDDAWTGFANARKQTGYRADQLPSTHPIAADNVDLHAVEVNFDMITYAKGASVLKQLVAWVGIDPFLEGLRAYFREWEYGNPEFKDLLATLEKSSGRELQGWAQEWLQTAGVNTLTPRFELDADGAYSSFSVEQSAHPDWPTLRRHRLGIGLYDEVGGRLVRRDYVEIDVEGASTGVAELVGVQQPALLLLNDEDHAYAKIRLDERSLATAISSLSTFDDSLPRALIWGAAWDMTRDAEMRTRDWVDLVLANIGAETDAWAVTRIPASTALSVAFYSDPAHRDELSATWESGLRELLLAAEPGSDHQLTFARSYAAAARSDAALDELIGLLDGSFVVEGLEIDQDMRWGLITALAKSGRFGDAEIDAELEVDKTISGKEQAAAARASQPTPEAKEAAWNAILDPSTPNETAREIAFSIFRFGQDDVLAPYLEKFLTASETLVDVLGFHKASTVLEYGFPKSLGSEATIARLDEWLADNNAPKQAQRYIGEARADIARALAAQVHDRG
ncbi:Membrane alanyl aminopeptidase Metallo peptidase. MEROPS family M01 [Nocardioides exalbidus]|uniref:Aminopeptidase N n=1 Tax=Nocardioides exalbidus TaxID=402596 RepID=A0A1H4JHT6_9ACTN|nr:aminopeptidase N [Nocardioides exalbidus]SEB45870.1 Membrane alanyl aminopeptidase Metallo peptidase. MEROPS family M01 [Nocardioides exalbidus]